MTDPEPAAPRGYISMWHHRRVWIKTASTLYHVPERGECWQMTFCIEVPEGVDPHRIRVYAAPEIALVEMEGE